MSASIIPRHKLSILRILVFASLHIVLPALLLTASAAAADQVHEDALAGVSIDSDVDASLLQFIYSRQCPVRLYPGDPGTPVCLPFRYPARPTLTFSIGAARYELLFDTGTQCCLLQLPPGMELPTSLCYSSEPGQLAALEGKRAYTSDSEVLLRYARSPTLSCAGQLYLRDVPWRVYPPSVNPDRDYAGAFAALLLADYFIVLDNHDCQIKLYARDQWQPPANSLLLPLLLLPRGYFVPVQLNGELRWFHLDTGFSGGLGLSSSCWEQLAPWLDAIGDTQPFSGWHAETSFAEARLSCPVTFSPYPASPWDAASALSLTGLTVLNLGSAYDELEGQGYRIGGIIGSGLLGSYNYALDLRLQRLYILGSAQEELP